MFDLTLMTYTVPNYSTDKDEEWGQSP